MIHYDIGGEQFVDIDEPDRGMFSDDLGGAIQYALARGLYGLLSVFGDALGSVVGGFVVRFLERIEPDMLSYASPILAMMLAQEDLDPHVREFLQRLATPSHAGGAAILAGVAQQAGGMVVGSLLGALQAPAAYKANQAIRPSLPDASALISMFRRGALSPELFQETMEFLGFKDRFIAGLLTVTEIHAGATDLVTALFRGEIDAAEFQRRTTEMGIPNADANILLSNYRRYLDPATMLAAWFRGEMTPDEIRSDLIAQGYSDIDITTLMTAALPIPGPGDLVRFGVRDAFRPEIVKQWGYDEDIPDELIEYMRKHGFDDQWSRYYWYAHWALPSTQQGYEMMHRGIISQEELQTLLRISDIPSFWRDRLMAMSYHPLTRVDVRRMYGLDVLDEEGVKRAYLDLGYSDANADAMTRFTILYEKPEKLDLLKKYKSETETGIIQAFKKGILDQATATTQMLLLGYDLPEANFLTELARWQEEIKDTPDFRADYVKDIKSIVEKGYIRRSISPEEVTTTLTSLGCSESECQYLMATADYYYNLGVLDKAIQRIGESYVKGGLNRSAAISALGQLDITSGLQAQVLGEWDLERSIPVRRLTEAQYRKALTSDIIGVNEYRENMLGLGYTAYDIWVLTSMAVGIEKAGSRPASGPSI